MNWITQHIYIPALVIILRFMLWGFDWVGPERLVEEAYETISLYYHRQYRLPDRTAVIMGHLNSDYQELLFNMAWQFREEQKAVDKIIDRTVKERSAPTTD